MSEKMQSVVVRSFGDASVLNIEDVEIPSPGANQVLVDVKSSGINYADIMQRENKYFAPMKLPFTPGYEIAGIITRARYFVLANILN